MEIEQVFTILAGLLVTYLFECFISIPVEGDEEQMEVIRTCREQFNRDEFHTLETYQPQGKPGAPLPLITTWDCPLNPA